MKTRLPVLAALTLLIALVGVAALTRENRAMSEETKKPAEKKDEQQVEKLAQATFGSGCFWCSEAVFQELKGVRAVQSGYTGGDVKDPTYEQVCAGTTGHAEVIQVTYDPEVISFKDLLEVFWKLHDPTTLNRQGNDVGTQYRSAIFYHDDEQRKLAEEYKKKLDESGAFRAPIVTEITELGDFYPAEDYHQNYFRENPRQGYCSFVIRPKVDKVREVFADKLKSDEERKTASGAE